MSSQIVLNAEALHHPQVFKCWVFFRNTPLILAADRGHTDVVQCLIKFGAAVSAKGQYQLTALHTAAQYGQLSTVSVLLASGADLDSRSRKG